MRALVFATLLAACGGPSRSQLADTPTARTPRTPTLAPPASTDDKDRATVDQQFDSMEDMQQAHREAAAASKAAPPAPLPPDPTLPGGPPGTTTSTITPPPGLTPPKKTTAKPKTPPKTKPKS